MINLETSIGKVSLAIAGEIKADKLPVILQKGMASEVYRAGASKVYGKKGHSRDEAYSPALEADVIAACKLVLGENFQDLTIAASRKPDVAPKLTAESVLAALSDEALEAALAARRNGKVEKSEDIG